MSPHNPSYYNDFTVSSGYLKAKDLLVYSVDMGNGYRMPDRFKRFSDFLLKKKQNLTVRKIDLKNIQSEAEHIWKIMNTAVSGNWGYVPIRMEANYILEDNVHIKNALLKLGMVKIKEYRVYEKKIGFKIQY